MAESKVLRDNYITIQGFMITDLKLKGNELIIYAVIYGFSQAENQTFSGSLQYLADWLNGTRQGVQKSLKSLIEKGFIVKTDKIVNGVKFCEYSATKGVYNSVAQCTTQLQGVYNSVERGCTTQLHGGVQLSCTNNIQDNISDIYINKESKKEKPTKTSFDKIIEAYAKGNEEITDLLQEWLKVRKAKRAPLTDRAIKMNIEKLDHLAAASGLSVAEYLKEVICRGWAAFYQIKNFNNGNEQPAAVNKGANGIVINKAPSALDSVF